MQVAAGGAVLVDADPAPGRQPGPKKSTHRAT